MDVLTTRRLGMSALGAVAGLAFYILTKLAEADSLQGRTLLVIAVATGVFFTGLLAMFGPLRLTRAALGAAATAVAVSGLMLLASFRFETVEGLFNSPSAALSAAVLALVPLPFWIAAHGAGWRDYPTLFGEAWSIVVRYAAAWAFVGVVWGVIFLSDALLSIVGMRLVRTILDIGPVPYLISGGVLGLGLAVVQELSDYLSPYLILRLLRLLLPIVLGVTVIFVVALPLRGISGLFGGLSAALTLLAMAGAAATLVTTAVDQEDAQATDSAILVWAARAMALLLPVLAGFGAWAVWLRVAQYGWTPDRVFAAEVAALGLGYGILYALSVLKGTGWMARIRQANIAMALALMGLAALSLTPILDAGRISVTNQMARLEDGRLPVDQLDVALLGRWGKAGDAAVKSLTERATQPGQEALAKRLAMTARDDLNGTSDPAALRARLRDILPLQPATATATRDIYLESLDPFDLQRLVAACEARLPGGDGPGCVMVVGDLLPLVPGEEAILASRTPDGYVSYEAFYADSRGVQRRGAISLSGSLPQFDQGADLIRQWQAQPPALSPAPLNQFSVPGGGVILPP